MIAANIAALICISYSLAKYVAAEPVSENITFEDFDVLVDKVNNLDKASLLSAGKIDGNGVITLTRSEYMNLSVFIKQKGKGKSCVRIRIEETWVKMDSTTSVVFSESHSYLSAPDIFDNTGTDGYLYVEGIVNATDNDNYTSIPVITGIASGGSAPTNATHVRLAIHLDAVQFNRYKVIWNMSNLPW